MTDVTDRPVRLEIDGDVTEEGKRATLSLNGAIVLRPARAGTAPRPASNDRGAGTDLRDRLVELHAATVGELHRRRDAAGLDAADSVPVPVKQLSSISREIPRLAGDAPRLAGAAGHAVTDGAIAAALRGTLHFLARQRQLAARHHAPGETVDEFGFDREWTESMLPFFRFLYRHYWRVRVEGLENVPGDSAALLVSNHAGVLPYDGAMIRMALFDDHPAHRHARALILSAFFGVPIASWFLRRTGNTLAHPDDAERLLRDRDLVLVFPEGAKGTGKPFKERYKLRRFGRGGFVSIALRTGAPIIPVSVVGSEEVHPMLANVTPVASAIGMPYFPLTPTFPWLGPLGLLPLPSSWVIRFHEPIATGTHGPDDADDAAVVMRLTDLVRDTIQAGLYASLEERGSVFR